MLKIVSCLFSLLLIGSIAVAGGSPAASSLAPGASASISSVCSDQKAACTAECHEFGGPGLAPCLRLCAKEYQECLSGHPTLTGEDAAAAAEGCDAHAGFDEAVANTSPQVCYDQLQACLVSCDGDEGTDFGCTRQCVRTYQKCLGH